MKRNSLLTGLFATIITFAALYALAGPPHFQRYRCFGDRGHFQRHGGNYREGPSNRNTWQDHDNQTDSIIH